MHAPDVHFVRERAHACATRNSLVSGSGLAVVAGAARVEVRGAAYRWTQTWVGARSKSHLIISTSLSLCLFSVSPPFSPHISICPSVFLLPPALVGRKIKVSCFLHEIFVSAFWLYLKIKLSLARCLSLRVCKPSSILAGVI